MLWVTSTTEIYFLLVLEVEQINVLTGSALSAASLLGL